jgi:hypothetical protein
MIQAHLLTTSSNIGSSTVLKAILNLTPAFLPNTRLFQAVIAHESKIQSASESFY